MPAGELCVTRRVQQRYDVFVCGFRVGFATTIAVIERDACRLHGDASILLIVAKVQISRFAYESLREKTVRHEQGVRQRGLSMVYMTSHADVTQSKWSLRQNSANAVEPLELSAGR
jgi:hypothetical protein